MPEARRTISSGSERPRKRANQSAAERPITICVTFSRRAKRRISSGRWRAGEPRELGAEALGEPHRLVDALQRPVARLLEIEAAEMHRDPGRVEPAREPAAGAHHGLRQGIGADADEDALGRRPGAFDGVLAQIDDHLVVDPIGRAPERELAQGGEIAGLEEIVRRAPGILGQIDLARPEAAG